jgi:hypothetical protein
VIAVNRYGESTTSVDGNGGIIVLVPDAPLLLTNRPEITSATVISFIWSAGVNDGGEPLIDYRILYDQSSSNYIVLVESISVLEYTTDFTLTGGALYKFKI